MRGHFRIRLSEEKYRQFYQLGEQFFDDTAPDNGRPLGAAVVHVGELNMVKTQQMQHRSVNVVNMRGPFDGAETDLVGGADGLAGLDAGQPRLSVAKSRRGCPASQTSLRSLREPERYGRA